jgi:hypothetical protein
MVRLVEANDAKFDSFFLFKQNPDNQNDAKQCEN